MKPTAAPPHFPYTTHRTMAEVLFDEKMDRERQRAFYNRKRKSWRRLQDEEK